MIEVKKGENISLLNIAPHLNEIIVAVKWFKKTGDKTEFDIDSSAFLLTEQNKVRNDADFIFYNQPALSDNAIILKNELFKITLNNISLEINKISFALTIHDAKQKQQCFGMLDKIIIELFDFTNKQKIAGYCLEDANAETAIILALLYRYNNEWKFRAIGQGYTDGLAVLARNFGVDIEESAEQSVQNQAEKIVDAKTNAPELKNSANIKANPLDSKANTANTKSQPKPQKNKTEPQKTTQLKNTAPAEKNTPDLDIHNTDMMTKQEHYEPIVQWLRFKNFEAEVNEAAMDTSGFFDEVAVELGDDYELLKIVSNTIKRRQVDKRTAYINFENYDYNSQQIEVIKKFCKQLYKYSFVAKYLHNSEENKIILHLQTAVKIVNFFNGEWLEWYAFMKIAALCHEKNIKFSCTRNMVINLPGESKYEIDVFFLINDTPLFIECKSGEYREFIDKYTRLRRKLFIPKPYFLMLTSGVDDEHVKGLTAMFDITFVNEKMLVDYFVETFLKKNS